MDSLGGEHLGNILEVEWAREERCLSIKNLWLMLLVGPALMGRGIEGTSKQFHGPITKLED